MEVIGVVLAGGAGTRLWPLTLSTSKQLLPVFDKPMIYYPLSTLVSMRVRDIVIITTPHDQEAFTRLIGTGERLGLNVRYAVQEQPRGIADALRICAHHIVGRDVALILGDNIFHGVDVLSSASRHNTRGGAHIFAHHVANPSAYGVVELDANGRALSIVEKPVTPRSSYAVTGLYIYDDTVVDVARALTPSARGELEITDVNEAYRRAGTLRVSVLDRGAAWLDTGTFTSLMQAGEFVRVVEERQGIKIGCLEEAAWCAGFIGDDDLARLGHQLSPSGYGRYLLDLLQSR